MFQHLRELNYTCRLWNEICCVYTTGVWLRFCGDFVSLCGKKHTALSIFSKHFNFKQKGRPNLKDTSAIHEPCASAVKTLGMNTNITYSPSVWLTSTHRLFQSHNPSAFAIKTHQDRTNSNKFGFVCFWMELLPVYCTVHCKKLV